MNNKLRRWMDKNKPGENYISLLYPHLHEIKELIKNSYTQNQILLFLRDAYEIKTSRQNLSAFIKRHKDKKPIIKEDKITEENFIVENKKNEFDELDEKFGHLI
jgi:hypothetical protein